MTKAGNGATQRILCRVEVEGWIHGDWSEWFYGMTLTSLSNGNTLVAGYIADQAALHGLINKVFALGLSLVAVDREVAKPREDSGSHSGKRRMVEQWQARW